MKILHVTDETFQDQVLDVQGRVLVDFYADWCGPCRMLSPVVEEIAAEHPSLRVVKLNVDEAERTAAHYQVMSIPTLILFENSVLLHQSVGVKPKEAIVRELAL